MAWQDEVSRVGQENIGPARTTGQLDFLPYRRGPESWATERLGQRSRARMRQQADLTPKGIAARIVGGAEDLAQCAATVVGVERSEIYGFTKSLHSGKRDKAEAWRRAANEVEKNPVSGFGGRVFLWMKSG